MTKYIVTGAIIVAVVGAFFYFSFAMNWTFVSDTVAENTVEEKSATSEETNQKEDSKTETNSTRTEETGNAQTEEADTGHAQEETAEEESSGAVSTHEESGASLWTFTDVSDNSDIQQTAVYFSVYGEVVRIGTFDGTCFDIRGSAWTLRDGASEGAICWMAGGGTEIGVFHENNKHVIKTAVIEEGSVEGGGFRGEFKTILEI